MYVGVWSEIMEWDIFCRTSYFLTILLILAKNNRKVELNLI